MSAFTFDSPNKKKQKTRKRSTIRVTTSHKITSSQYLSSIKNSIVKQCEYSYTQLDEPGIYSNVTKEIFAESPSENGLHQLWAIFQIFFVVVGLLFTLEHLLKSKKKSEKLNKWHQQLSDIMYHLAKMCADIKTECGDIQENSGASGMTKREINRDILSGLLWIGIDSELLEFIITCLDYISTFEVNYEKYKSSIVVEEEIYSLASQFMTWKYYCLLKEYERTRRQRIRVRSFTPSRQSRSNSSSISVSVSGVKRKRREIRSGSIELLNDSNDTPSDVIPQTKCLYCPCLFTSEKELNIHGLHHLIIKDDNENTDNKQDTNN